MDLLNNKIPDRVPHFELLIFGKVINALHKDVDYLEFCVKEDIDLLFIKRKFHNSWIDKENGLYTNEWKVLRKVGSEDTHDYIDGPIKTINDLKNLKIPDPLDDYIFSDLVEAVNKYKKNKIICFFSKATFNFPWSLIGSFQQYLMEFYQNPELIRKLHKVSEDYHLAMTEKALDLGADIIALTDDYAYRDKMFIPRDKFKEFCLGPLERMSDLVHRKGGYLLFHSDGNLEEVLDLIIDTGIDFLHPVEPGAMDIKKVYDQYKDRVIICGNLDCAHTLTFGTPGDVRKEALWLLENIAPEGRYIMSSSNTIHSKVKPENYRMMLDTIKTYGKYPITV
ncbi:MAG: uroporphyrinogen decarboxylase family protein [Candidatus Humimicrobiaceae bacterium]